MEKVEFFRFVRICRGEFLVVIDGNTTNFKKEHYIHLWHDKCGSIYRVDLTTLT